MMDLKDKQARIQEIEDLTTTLYEEKFMLEHEVEAEKVKVWYESGVPAKVVWELQTKSILENPEWPWVNFRAVGEIPDDYFSVFGGYHSSLDINNLTFGVDDSDAWARGETLAAVLEFMTRFNVDVRVDKLMDVIRKLSEKIEALKQVYCRIKKISLEDVEWP
jgi:hypothetical protein